MKNTPAKFKNQVSEISESVLGKKAKRIRKIETFGDVNEVYFVEADSNKYVFRLNNDRGFDEFSKEKWCMEQATKVGIPTTSVLEMGDYKGISYMIQPYIESVNGSEFPDKEKLWHSLGVYAKKCHGIAVSGWGESLFDSVNGTFRDSWERYVNYNIESLNPNDKLIEMGLFNIQQSQKLKGVFIKVLDMKFNFGLCHGDISPKNSIVDNKGKVWLIDWGSAHAHVIPHYEFSYILGRKGLKTNSKLFKEFLNGYRMTLAEFKRLEPELDILRVLFATDKLRWAIDRKPQQIKKFTNLLKEVLPFVL